MANKILVVDDEHDCLRVLTIKLQHEGYDVICAANGQQGIDLANQVKPDVIILDIMMPDMDGFEVKAKLNKDPYTALIPVIFLSADISIESKLGGFSLRANDYITKPFNTEELLARICAILTQKHYYENLSLIDGLTGLYNHTFFKQQLLHFFNLAKRYLKPFSLIIADINDLKRINDTYGHLAGDCVLKEFSSIVSHCVRKSDMMFRYGGDEFAILLPETNISQSEAVAKKIIENISTGIVCVPNSGTEVRFSISIGAAEFDDTYRNESEIFDRADKKLYKDKANSRE